MVALVDDQLKLLYQHVGEEIVINTGSVCIDALVWFDMQQDNFIHGDLHPGNIFVRFVNNVPKVVLLDVGMTAELNAHSRSVMLDLFKVIILPPLLYFDSCYTPLSLS